MARSETGVTFSPRLPRVLRLPIAPLQQGGILTFEVSLPVEAQISAIDVYWTPVGEGHQMQLVADLCVTMPLDTRFWRNKIVCIPLDLANTLTERPVGQFVGVLNHWFVYVEVCDG